MRETCLRVLAAGLMTGAIAAVVGMPVLFGMPSDPGRPITAPPSSLERAVRIHVAPAPPHKRVVERVRSARPVSRARPSVIARNIVIIHTTPPRRRLASTKPKPTLAAPTPPATPAVAAATPPAEVAQVQAPLPAPPASDDDEGNDSGGHGHAYGHDKEHGQGHNEHQD